jgi:hypothetical protein
MQRYEFGSSIGLPCFLYTGVIIPHLKTSGICPSSYIVKFTTAEKVSKILVTMQNRKAPDELSLVAEHLRNGGPIVCCILEKLFNKIYEEGHIPEVFK